MTWKILLPIPSILASLKSDCLGGAFVSLCELRAIHILHLGKATELGGRTQKTQLLQIFSPVTQRSSLLRNYM